MFTPSPRKQEQASGESPRNTGKDPELEIEEEDSFLD